MNQLIFKTVRGGMDVKPNMKALRAVCHDTATNEFYAVGDAMTITSSQDGETWVDMPDIKGIHGNSNLYGVFYAPGAINRAIACGKGGIIVRLGVITAQVVRPPATGQPSLSCGIYHGGLYIWGGERGHIVYSKDLETFHQFRESTSEALKAVTTNGSKILFAGSGGITFAYKVEGGKPVKLFRSKVMPKLESTYNLYAATYSSGIFYVGGKGGWFFGSVDGSEWRELKSAPRYCDDFAEVNRDPSLSFSCGNFISGDAKFGSFIGSYDGSKWTRHINGDQSTLTGISSAYDRDRWVIVTVGARGTVLRGVLEDEPEPEKKVTFDVPDEVVGDREVKANFVPNFGGHIGIESLVDGSLKAQFMAYAIKDQEMDCSVDPSGIVNYNWLTCYLRVYFDGQQVSRSTKIKHVAEDPKPAIPYDEFMKALDVMGSAVDSVNAAHEELIYLKNKYVPG